MTAEFQVSPVSKLTEISPDELTAAFAEFLRIDVADGDASTDTVRTYISQIQQDLDWCAYSGMNPALGVKPPREKRDPAERITFLEKPELKQFLSALADDGTLKSLRERALIEIMALEGPRTVEMYRANLSDVVQQGDELGIRVEGKRNIRIVPLTPRIAKSLKVYLEARLLAGETLEPSSPLFIAVGNRAGGKRLSRCGIRRIVDQYLNQCNLKHRPGRKLSAHSLRHTAGTLALRAGADLRQVQDLLGHADPRTTSIYAHVADRWANNPALKLEI